VRPLPVDGGDLGDDSPVGVRQGLPGGVRSPNETTRPRVKLALS
jgi:hypothetical protein